ncbi:MAG: hypothetical protein ACXAEU_16520 [Candidatus Hodarchaeales archaeon]|jgi:hypothetical protein
MEQEKDNNKPDKEIANLMKECMESIFSEEMMKGMQDVMPRMLETYFPSVSKEEKDKISNFCQTMFQEMEKMFAH